jgi:hypothetical protein
VAEAKRRAKKQEQEEEEEERDMHHARPLAQVSKISAVAESLLAFVKARLVC